MEYFSYFNLSGSPSFSDCVGEGPSPAGISLLKVNNRNRGDSIITSHPGRRWVYTFLAILRDGK